jgi:hypothetical protein
MDRYPTFYIVIFSDKNVYHGSKTIKISPVQDKSRVIEEIRQKTGAEIKRLGLEEVDCDFSTRLWGEYYDSQYIPARKNINAQKICFGSYKVPELRLYARKKENKSLNDY